MDMHCAHMGASLAAGSVVGECIQCPFHHWRYDATGACAHIPYMEAAKIPKAARITSYPVLERFDTIHLYNGESPSFSLPDMPEYHDPGFLITFSEIPIPVHQLAFMENAVDYMHLVHLHGIRADKVACEVIEEQPGSIEFRVLMEGVGYEIARLYRVTELSVRSLFVAPNMSYGALEHNGKLVARWILSTSPVDASHTRVFATWMFRRLPRPLRLFDPIYRKLAGISFDTAVKQDIKLSWQNMRPDRRRAWVADDSQIQKLHGYYRSFMPEHALTRPTAPGSPSSP